MNFLSSQIGCIAWNVMSYFAYGGLPPEEWPLWLKIMALFFILLFVSSKVAQDAINRGKTYKVAFFWFLATFCFGIGGIIWLQVRPPHLDELPTHMCRVCKAIFRGNPTYCPGCGRLMID